MTAQTRRETLLALVERCKSEEPSEELDLAILDAVGGNGNQWRKFDSANPNFSHSLDAAVTLVPEGDIWSAHGSDAPGHRGYAEISTMREPHYFRADACTPALALCAAALRAIAQEETAP